LTAQGIRISDYVSDSSLHLSLPPWETCARAAELVESQLANLSSSYRVIGPGIAAHHTSIIENGAVLKAPCIIGENCFIAAYAYLRGGVWLDSNVIIGPSAEIKSSFFFNGSKAAHLNFIGDSIIGRNANIEAGAILANYRNERDNKEIVCFDGRHHIHTGCDKFGSLVGDGCRIGANAVLAPGTVLARGTIVGRLALIDQEKTAAPLTPRG
jgi:UDP-N-acetylglucosamine diphosphorylase / glucose-1-phosphate thymidylyltransferase / UDP-N-acetylgalactosamine diphosphorylase / glucosamine-1-phosphate N-acetyltransferase / galactosamine-1-phosphate N-acetyltransferase